MNVCVTVNSLYMRYLYVMLQSLYENNKPGSITLYVLQKDFTKEDKQQIVSISEKYGNKVEFIWIDERKCDELPDTFKNTQNLSVEILFRLLIPECLPESIDRVLMLDVDIVVNRDITELYESDFEGCVLAAAPNIGANCEIVPVFREWYNKDRSHWIHFNTGVLLWNLKKLREEFPREYIFNCALKHNDIKKPQFEEELFNVEFGENLIKVLPVEWNYQARVLGYNLQNPKYKRYTTLHELKQYGKIIHYVGTNPWQDGVKNIAYRIWWEYCKETPFYCELLEESYVKSEQRLKQKEEILASIENMSKRWARERVIAYLKKLKYRKVMIYGVDRCSRLLKQMLLEMGVRIDCFIEGSYNIRVLSEGRIGYPVIDVKDVESRRKALDVVIVSEQNCYESVKASIERYSSIEVLSIDWLMEEHNLCKELLKITSGKSARIAIYGAGYAGKKVYSKLQGQEMFNICAWVDKAFEKLGEPVQSPEVLLKNEYDYILIAVEKEKLVEEINRELAEIGIIKEKVVWFPKVSIYD